MDSYGVNRKYNIVYFRAKIDETNKQQPVGEEDNTDKEDVRPDYELKDEDDKTCRNMFVSLQYLAAISGSLGHGGNDVGNCIGPLVTSPYLSYPSTSSSLSPA